MVNDVSTLQGFHVAHVDDEQLKKPFLNVNSIQHQLRLGEEWKNKYLYSIGLRWTPLPHTQLFNYLYSYLDGLSRT